MKKYIAAIPYVGAIIERKNKGNIEVLIQTRFKPHKDPIYSGTFEFVIGTLDKPYENVFDALAREIYEECGLKLKSIKNNSQTRIYNSDKDDAAFGFQPFCCTQQLKNGKPWIGFVFICEVEEGICINQPSENKDVRWISINEIKNIFENFREKLFTIELPAWDYYFRKKSLLNN